MRNGMTSMRHKASLYSANILFTHTHTRLTALLQGLPRWAGTRKVKPMWILEKQETVSGSGISWAICKSAPRSRQITTPAPHQSIFFTGRMPFLPPNQQRQSTEGTNILYTSMTNQQHTVTQRFNWWTHPRRLVLAQSNTRCIAVTPSRPIGATSPPVIMA